MLTFVPPRRPGQPAGTYHCELHADGAALGALQVGALRDSPTDGGKVWALGEGAIAWITVAMLRLTAAFADQSAVLGEAVVEATITSAVGATRRTVDLATCLTPGLTTAARPLVIGLLRQFGLTGSRHIDPAGAPLPGALYRSAVGCFGEFGTAELVFLIAQYAAVSMVLNAYDVPLPPDAE
ncbi:hypothetical protein [Nonomuraea sp. NPDC005650]|uniref:hypothetical protein n=1 Tax=Nonomuraea sp. NPDC005650 TaxID=3157045 RepID=UPI0033B4F747